MAVAIWDHEPAPGALLARRIARGWNPTPTETRDGPVVLGYAACLAYAGRPGESGNAACAADPGARCALPRPVRTPLG